MTTVGVLLLEVCRGLELGRPGPNCKAITRPMSWPSLTCRVLQGAVCLYRLQLAPLLHVSVPGNLAKGALEALPQRNQMSAQAPVGLADMAVVDMTMEVW